MSNPIQSHPPTQSHPELQDHLAGECHPLGRQEGQAKALDVPRGSLRRGRLQRNLVIHQATTSTPHQSTAATPGLPTPEETEARGPPTGLNPESTPVPEAQPPEDTAEGKVETAEAPEDEAEVETLFLTF